MNIKQNLVSPVRYGVKCPYSMTPESIVVHNTANDASAANEISYMIGNANEVSFHYAVDDKEIIQGIPENRNAWHAGDGGSGKGNRKGIGIEICYSKSGGTRFTAAEKLAAKFIAYKLKQKGWGIDKVTKHQDYSGKYCPHRTLDMGWQRFINMIKAELGLPGDTAPGVLYKVQVGAYSVKANADAMLSKLKGAGFDGNMIQVNGLYKIQVGAYGVKANAEAMQKKLKAAGFEAVITTQDGAQVPAGGIIVGSKVKIKQGAKTYEGKTLSAFVYDRVHVVKEISGERVVVTYSGTVVAAIRKSDLILV